MEKLLCDGENIFFFATWDGLSLLTYFISFLVVGLPTESSYSLYREACKAQLYGEE